MEHGMQRPEPETVKGAMEALLAGQRSTGQEWMRDFLLGLGHVHFNADWLAFSVGQAGMALDKGNVALAREMVNRLDGDIQDLEDGCRTAISLARQMAFNADQTVKRMEAEG